jgi:hypothetical protein
MGKMSIHGSLFTDNLAVGLFKVNDLQKGIYKMVKCYRDWNLKCNLQKTKILDLRTEEY